MSRSGKLGPTEKTTFAHEYTHALQDQNFDLGSLKLDEVGEGDQGIAGLSLVEGDATLVMSLWQIQHLSQVELLAAPQRVARTPRSQAASTRCRRSSASRCCSRTRPA